MKALKNGCPEWSSDATKQSEMLSEYAKYAESYTDEEVDWYGLSYNEAIKKLSQILKAQEVVQPHKIAFRSELIEQLRKAGIVEAEATDQPDSSTLP